MGQKNENYTVIRPVQMCSGKEDRCSFFSLQFLPRNIYVTCFANIVDIAKVDLAAQIAAIALSFHSTQQQRYTPESFGVLTLLSVAV